MPTQAKENYLKALYHLHLKNEEISLTELGQFLAVSKPTVNDMIKKMHTQNWVAYKKYKPIRLTVEGKKKAALVIRKHRLAEMFLSQIMGFGWEEVHDIAEEMEHLKSELLFDRMDQLLGYPTIDPHGSPIPDKNGNIVKHDLKKLSGFSSGQKLVIKAIRESSTDFLLFLNKKKLLLGTEIIIKEIEPFDQSMMLILSDLSEIVISNSVSKRLLVESV